MIDRSDTSDTADQHETNNMADRHDLNDTAGRHERTNMANENDPKDTADRHGMPSMADPSRRHHQDLFDDVINLEDQYYREG